YFARRGGRRRRYCRPVRHQRRKPDFPYPAGVPAGTGDGSGAVGHSCAQRLRTCGGEQPGCGGGRRHSGAGNDERLRGTLRKSELLYKAREMGMDLSQHEEELKVALKHLKKLEHEGYEFEAAEASLRVLLESAVHGETEFFTIDNFRVVTEMRRDGEVTSEAT